MSISQSSSVYLDPVTLNRRRSSREICRCKFYSNWSLSFIKFYAFFTADKRCRQPLTTPKGHVQTRAQSRSEGVSDENRIQNRTLPENYGPKSLEFLPDNFLVDPDNLVRKSRALRKNKRCFHSSRSNRLVRRQGRRRRKPILFRLVM